MSYGAGVQDRYVGDVGDFGKYGLLRALMADASPRRPQGLGVIWYLTTPEAVADAAGQEDGKHRAYLSGRADHYARCDPELHAAMHGFLDPARRTVSQVAAANILPPSTRYHDEALDFTDIGPGRPRREHRRAWFDRALAEVNGCGLVFLDPDNGLECKSHRPWSKKGPKYVAISEVTELLDRGHGVVIYHHIGRRGSAVDQARGQLARFDSDGFAVLYRRGTCRAFVVLEPGTTSPLRAAAEKFVGGPWKAHVHPELISR